MAQYGTRDGTFTVKKLEVRNKVPVVYSIPKLSTIGTAAILAGWDVSGDATRYATAYLMQPPYPVNISVQAWDAGAAAHADTIKIIGFDEFGEYAEETVWISGTAKALNYSKKNFSKITALNPSASCTSTDVNIGYGTALGLPWPIATSADIITYMYNSAYATTVDYKVDATYNRIRPKTVVGDVSLMIIYRSTLQ